VKFKDIVVNKTHKFSIGIEEDTGRYYVSIPVSNQYIDYEEYYEITNELFETFIKDIHSALDFVNKCRNHKNDNLLIQKPGSDRGIPI